MVGVIPTGMFALEVNVVTVTAQSQRRLPIPLSSADRLYRLGEPRPRPQRALSWRSNVADIVLVTVAMATVAGSSLWRSVLQGLPRYRAYAIASTTAGLIGFTGVLTYRGVVHIPGTRTAVSLTNRVAKLLSGSEPAHVPTPAQFSIPNPKPLVVRQVVPNAGGNEAGPNEPGSDPPPVGGPQASPDQKVTPTVSSTPVTGANLPPPPPSARLKSVTHVWQTWNNCGPATVTMALSAIGKAETQPAAVAFLKTSSEDKNVNPNELIEYIRSRGALSEWRTGGDLVTLKRLLALGIPVIVEVGFEYEPGDWMGHYRLLVGYDDAARRFIAYDSYQAPGINVPQPYDAFDANWRAFNRTFMPVYLANNAAEVSAIAGDPRDPALLDRALARAVADAEANPTIAFAWFNVGTSLVAVNRMEEAAEAFDTARRLKLPWRMLWYQFGPFEAYLNTGRLDDVLVLANTNINYFSQLEESHYYKGRVLQARGKVAEARAEYRLALKANARYVPAWHFLSTLPAS